MFLNKKAARSLSLSTTCALFSLLFAGCGGGGGTSGGSNNTGAPAAGRFVPNYAQETDPQTNQPNRLLHWDHFPVRIHFVQNEHLTDHRKSLAIAGFGWWTSSLDGSLKYEYVDSPSNADVTIRFEPKGVGATGVTQYSYAGSSELVTADITLNLDYLSNPAFISATAAHEFGHALGIGGHSADRLDLMATAPNLLGLFRPTIRDENTMKTAYIPVLEGRAGSPGPLRTETISCTLQE